MSEWGGVRKGSGSKKNLQAGQPKNNVIPFAKGGAVPKAKYGEPTKAMRIPARMEQSVLHYVELRSRVWLEADNKKYDPITLDPNLENLVCGMMLISIRPISNNHIKKFR